jgi:hypothetical protein
VRPVLLVVHLARSGQPRQATPKVTARPAVIRRVTRFGAGHGAGGLVDGEVVGGEPAVHRRSQWGRFDDRGVSGLNDRGPGITGAVGGVTEHLQAAVFTLEQFQPDHGLVVAVTAAPGEFPAGDSPVSGSTATWPLKPSCLVVHGPWRSMSRRKCRTG